MYHKMDLWIALIYLVNGTWKLDHGDRLNCRHRDHAATCGFDGKRQILEPVQPYKHALDPAIESICLKGRDQSAPAAQKQGKTDSTFKIGDQAANAWLRGMHHLRGSRD